MERGSCPIAVLYFAVKRSFFNIKNFVGQQGYQCYHMLGDDVTWRHRSRDHKTRGVWFPIGDPLTPTLYPASLLRYYASSVR